MSFVHAVVQRLEMASLLFSLPLALLLVFAYVLGHPTKLEDISYTLRGKMFRC